MSFYIPLFLIVLALIAVFFRADFILVLTYLLLGVYFIGRFWGTRALKNVIGKRKFTDRVFYGEMVEVEIEISNQSWMPVVWLQLHESFPINLVTGQRSLQEVISLKPKEKVNYRYVLDGRKRGVYPIGPLFLSSGDIFGLGNPESRQIGADSLVVYPKIVSLTNIKLPSRSPMGTLRHSQPIYEDPSRVRGKREYTSGDSLRSIDWKSSASSGRLQVKLFEPSIALATAIFLDLNSASYNRQSRINSTELAIIVAASLANWVISKKQSAGLVTNGVEQGYDLQVSRDGSETPFQHPIPIPPNRGQGHLMRILEVLARVQVVETVPIVQLLRQESTSLVWGTTVVIITPMIDELLFEGIFHANRSGLKPVLMPCGPVHNVEEIRKKADYFGIPFHQIFSEEELDQWRK
jgi:uncharacterized protein (DUF58 family)